MELLIIYARTPDDGCIWVDGAYDTTSREDCPEVWEELVKKARAQHGDNFRVQRVKVPWSSVEALFGEPLVDGEPVEEKR